MPNLIGQSIGRYHILEQIGEGGMAIVYKAYDTRLERDVAIKIIRPNAVHRSQVDRILKRFEREAKALAKLSHPNIVGVIDYGEHEGEPYLVLVYLRGGTLKTRMGKPMPWQEAALLLVPVANALEYAHEHKVVHRDVKPANILLTEKGQPMLSDFGIAKILEAEVGQRLTGTGVGIGTPEYIAPEQGMGKPVDGRADIYSLGIIFYELITGRKPYSADTPLAVVLKHLNEPLPPPSQFVPDLPEAVESVLFKALAKDPQDRYPTAGVFATALENLAGGIQPRSAASEPPIASMDDSSVTMDILETNQPALDGGGAASLAKSNETGNPRSSKAWFAGLAAAVVILGVISLTILWAGRNGSLPAGSIFQTATRTPLQIFTQQPINTPPPLLSSTPTQAQIPDVVNIIPPETSDSKPTGSLFAVYGSGEKILISEQATNFLIVSKDCSQVVYAEYTSLGNDGKPTSRSTLIYQWFTTKTRTTQNWPFNHIMWSFSPNTDQVTYTANDNINIYPPNAGTNGQITTDPGWAGYPKWSPDGKFIAFFSANETGSFVSVIQPDASDYRLVSKDVGKVWEISWTVDNQIVFPMEITPGTRKLFSINPDGTGLKDVTGTTLLVPDQAQCGWPSIKKRFDP